MKESHHQRQWRRSEKFLLSFLVCALFDDENRRELRVNEKKSHESLIATHSLILFFMIVPIVHHILVCRYSPLLLRRSIEHIVTRQRHLTKKKRGAMKSSQVHRSFVVLSCRYTTQQRAFTALFMLEYENRQKKAPHGLLCDVDQLLKFEWRSTRAINFNQKLWNFSNSRPYAQKHQQPSENVENVNSC